MAFRSSTLHTEARSLNDLVIAGDLKAVTAHLNHSGMLVFLKSLLELKINYNLIV